MHGPGCLSPKRCAAQQSTPRRVLQHEVHVQDCSRRSRTYHELLYKVDQWPQQYVLRDTTNIHENDQPMKVSYTTRSPRSSLKVSMEKTDLRGRLETTQSNRLQPSMTRPSTTAPPASETTAVVIRLRCARVDLSRILLSCANVPPHNWAPPYHARSLSQSSNRYVVRCLWLDLLLSSVRLSVIACLSSRS